MDDDWLTPDPSPLNDVHPTAQRGNRGDWAAAAAGGLVWGHLAPAWRAVPGVLVWRDRRRRAAGRVGGPQHRWPPPPARAGQRRGGGRPRDRPDGQFGGEPRGDAGPG